MKRALPFGLCLLLVVCAAAAETPAPFVVIVNAENPVAAASPAMISGLFLKRRGKWQSGLKPYPVDLVESSRVREAFSLQVLGQRTSEIELYWQSAIFSGRDIPPPKKASEIEIVAFVAQHPGAIGYVSPATPLAPRVKVLQVRKD